MIKSTLIVEEVHSVIPKFPVRNKQRGKTKEVVPVTFYPTVAVTKKKHQQILTCANMKKQENKTKPLNLNPKMLMLLSAPRVTFTIKIKKTKTGYFVTRLQLQLCACVLTLKANIL